jgi:hypothetical protein
MRLQLAKSVGCPIATGMVDNDDMINSAREGMHDRKTEQWPLIPRHHVTQDSLCHRESSDTKNILYFKK